MLTLNPDLVYSLVNLYLIGRFDEPVPTPKFHRELWEYACSPKKYVAIAAPRGFAKSTALTHAYVLANVLFRIKDHILIVSDTESQSVLFLGDIKRELLENDALVRDFQVKKLVKDSETEVIIEFKDGKQARLVARGSEQKARGLKWRNKRPNLIVGDDLENDEIVLNEDRRAKFRNWFLNALLNSGSRSCHVRIVGTILHFDSLLARLMPQENDSYTINTPLKMWSEDPNKAWYSVLYRAHPSVDNFEELLWSDMWPKERLLMERQKYQDENYLEGYAQEYLNNPIDEGTSYFRREDLTPIPTDQKDETKREPEEYYCGVDLAISERDKRAYSVIVTCGLNSDNILRVREIRRFRGDGNEIIDELFFVHRKWKPNLIVIEDENISKALGGVINARMAEENCFLNIHPVKPIHDKIRRARSLQARARVNAIQFDDTAGWYPELEQEMLRFPLGRYTDQVDALAWVCFILDQLTPALTQEELNNEEWEEEYEQTYLSAPGANGRSMWTGY